jgi:hypothetical protein
MKRNLSIVFKSWVVFGLCVILLLSQMQAIVVTQAAPLVTTWYVNAATGSDTNTCQSTGDACLSIGEAVSRAENGDTVQIAAGVYAESLDISLELTLVGAGSGSTFLDGENTNRVLTASSTGLTVSDLTIRNGLATGQNGGGVYNFGTLLLQNVTVTNNSVVTEGGSGIFNTGTLTLEDGLVQNNTADGVGGGIYTWYGSTTTVLRSTINENSGAQGGGIFNLGTLNVLDSSITNNSAAMFGGGLAIFSGNATLTSVTISGNQTDGYGAGILNNLGGLTLANVTISGNLGNDYSGLANISSSAQTTVLNSTIASNLISSSGVRTGGVANISDGVISLKNSIVADNDGRDCLVSGSWTSDGYNLAGDNTCSFTSVGDQQNADPSLAPLGDYGGYTMTHALLPGSPAMDAADNVGCPASDQRGVTRPFDGDNNGTATCDIGSFEVRSQITVNNITVGEGDSGTTQAIFEVSLAPASLETVTVDYATANGTALAGFDYVTASGTLTFDPGETSQPVTITINGDTTDEPDETFLLNLSQAINADIITDQAVGTILDDDGLPALTISDLTINEGSSGSTVAQFNVSLSPVSPNSVTVQYTTVNGTALAGSDFQSAAGMLTFDPGETSQSISITILGDVIDEGIDEHFTIQLSSATNANLVDSSAQGVILDDDTARVSLGVGDEVVEGNFGVRYANFSVELDVPASFTVTVDYATSSGTGGNFATPDVDFETTTGTLTFAPGETMKTFSVVIYGDFAVEADEVFSVMLSNASPISIYASNSMGTILNDDSGNLVFMPAIIRAGE